MTTDLYILGDADQVRDGIDKRLLQGQLKELQTFSATLTSSISSLLRSFEDEMDAEVIMAGGDDLLIRVPERKYSIDVIIALADRFQKETGCAISFGVGATLSIAYINLRRAKAEKSGICFEAINI